MKQIRFKGRLPRWMTVVVVGLGLVACENKEYAALMKLRKELKASNDTVFAFSMKNHYALWIHTEEPRSDWEGPDDGTYSLYYRNLKTGETERLFTTLKDTLRLMPGNEMHRVSSGFTLKFSSDSCALILSDDTYVTTDFVCLYPLTGNRETLYFLTHDRRYAKEERQNVYRGEKFIPIPQFERFEVILYNDDNALPWYPSGGTRYLYYNTRGEVIDSSATISLSCREKGTRDRHQRQTITLTDDEFNDPRMWVKRLIQTQTYTLADVYQIAKNEVKFKQMFDGKDKTEFFDLYATHLEEREERDETIYLVKGKGFTISTEDDSFVEEIDFPCHIVIKATVTNLNEMLEALSNPYAAYLYAMLGAAEPALLTFLENMEGDFLFGNASLVYSY